MLTKCKGNKCFLCTNSFYECCCVFPHRKTKRFGNKDNANKHCIFLFRILATWPLRALSMEAICHFTVTLRIFASHFLFVYCTCCSASFSDLTQKNWILLLFYCVFATGNTNSYIFVLPPSINDLFISRWATVKFIIYFYLFFYYMSSTQNKQFKRSVNVSFENAIFSSVKFNYLFLFLIFIYFLL